MKEISKCSLYNKCNKSKINSCKQTNKRVQQEFLKSYTTKGLCDHLGVSLLLYESQMVGLCENEKQPVSTFASDLNEKCFHIFHLKHAFKQKIEFGFTADYEMED
uniref:Uncharacterized protein n=1 Tax=Glossina pallidipes TaxID=7398 RepID=A0A1A9ZXP7_GLOPL